MLQVELAQPSDTKEIEALLNSAALPLPQCDLPDSAGPSFLLARENGTLLACIAFERFGKDALLRSHVVHAESRGKGIGSRLVIRLLEEIAGNKALRAVYLLTIDATAYFSRFAFVPVSRDAVPKALLDSQEFSMHSCDNAVCMYRQIDSALRTGEVKR